MMDFIFEHNLEQITDALGWRYSVFSPKEHPWYDIVTVNRNTVSHSFGYLCGQLTDKSDYRLLESTVELIFVDPDSFDLINSFSQDCIIPVLPGSDILPVMTDWNMELLGEEPSKMGEPREEQEIIHIIEENPIQQIYTHLQSLTSRYVAKQAVLYHAGNRGTVLSEEVVNAKAEGVSYLVQNAIDYYDNASTENITQRLLNLYYGTIALMEAEMLMYGHQYSQLSEIEAITKSGHGMTTFSDGKDFTDFFIAVLDKGLFQAWLSHRGVDVSGFASSRQKAENSDFVVSLDELLRHIPELQNIMQEINPDYKPYFLCPCHGSGLGYPKSLYKTVYERKYDGEYVTFLNLDSKPDQDWEKQVIEKLLAPITIIDRYKSSLFETVGWRTFVKHRKGGNHQDGYHTHTGMSTSRVIASLFGRTDDWEVFAVMILYALSIIVRYMPNLWARILHGDLDYNKAILYQFSRVAERELTQIFLEKLTGKRVTITRQ